METKKVLWTVLSVTMALVVVSGIALALTYPRGGSANAPATIAAVAPPRVDSPDAYVRAVEPPPPQATPPSDKGTDIVIIYGDKPAPATLSAAGSTGAPLPAAAIAPQAAEPAASAKPYTPAPAASSAAPVPKPTSTPAAKPAATPAKPAAAKPAAPKSVNEYWIQAAAFSSRTRADDLQRDLASKGLSTLITIKDIDGVTWYRVRVGPYRTETEAKGWLERIKAMAGCSEAYVSRQTSRSS